MNCVPFKIVMHAVVIIIVLIYQPQWSYGVTCWEIFTGGAIPYPGIHPRDVLDYLEEDERLSRPKNAACCDSM